jgi:hypothetical protein
LNHSEPANRTRGSLSIDPRAGSSRDLDYLLEDDEEQRGGGKGKFVVIVLVLLVAGAFGYVRWKNQAWPFQPAPAKPAQTAAANDDSNSPTPPSSGTPSQGAPPSTTGDGTAAQNVKPETGSEAANPAPVPSATPSDATSAENSSAGSARQPSSHTDATLPKVPSKEIGIRKPVPVTSKAAPAAGPKSKAPVRSSVNKPFPGAVARPSAPAVAAQKSDPVGEAKKYLYGRGAPQSCEHGMHLLRPAAEQSNPKAMVEMGALYSAGLCTPRDLPTAYRWFALALRKEPENVSLQSDLKKLWGEMTQPERQQAIKLSQ